MTCDFAAKMRHRKNLLQDPKSLHPIQKRSRFQNPNCRHQEQVSGSSKKAKGINESEAVQWGSEILTSMDFKWSKRGWVANGMDFERDLKSGCPTI